MTQSDDFRNDPLLKDIDKNKLDFLHMLVQEGSHLSPKELLAYLTNLMKQGKMQSISFTKDEMNAMITVLKKNSTPDELQKMDKIMKLYQSRK